MLHPVIHDNMAHVIVVFQLLHCSQEIVWTPFPNVQAQYKILFVTNTENFL